MGTLKRDQFEIDFEKLRDDLKEIRDKLKERKSGSKEVAQVCKFFDLFLTFLLFRAQIQVVGRPRSSIRAT